jgi:DNA-binding MarR family transcriptional regulator
MRADGRILKRYATRSEADFALIASLVNSGASYEQVKACYITSNHPKHLDPQGRDFDRRLTAEYLRAKEQGHRKDFLQAREIAERIKAWAMGAKDLGNPRTRETDRRILIAHCERAIKAGKEEWHMSQRDIEKEARVTLMTAHRGTKRLIKAGYLTHKGQGKSREQAQTYSWGTRARDITLTHTSSVCKCSTPCAADYARHPAFEQAGLGRYAARIFETLVHLGDVSARELAEQSGCARRTVHKWLRLMLRLQLVGCDAGRWWACPERLDEVARLLGTQHIPVFRAVRIEHERSAYRRKLRRGRENGSS